MGQVLLAVGCGKSSGRAALSHSGQVSISLTSTSTQGMQYWLRHATFTIAGFVSDAVDTDDNPTAESIQLNLPTGDYTVQLEGGWVLERMDGDGGSEPVEAVLTSPNPVDFTIYPQTVTEVRFRFRVSSDDDTVEFTNGTVTIDFEVDDLPLCEDGEPVPDLPVVMYTESIPYGASGDPPAACADASSIAVRDDGVVSIAINHFPLWDTTKPLRVATRDTNGAWTYVEITDDGLYAVAHYLQNGDLGVIYEDHSDSSGSTTDEVVFATVSDSAVTREHIFDVDGGTLIDSGNQEGLPVARLFPWVLDKDGTIQAVGHINDSWSKGRLRRTDSGWDMVGFSQYNHDVKISEDGAIWILSTDGLWRFADSELDTEGTLMAVVGGVPWGGTVVVDDLGTVHIAYASQALPNLSSSVAAVEYGVWTSDGWSIETVREDVRQLLNEGSLLIDRYGRPYLIMSGTSPGHLMIVGKRCGQWLDMVDLGSAINGTMVLGPQGDIHVAYTLGDDLLVHYARIRVE